MEPELCLRNFLVSNPVKGRKISRQGQFRNAIGLTEDEGIRCIFSSYLFVTTLPMAMAGHARRADLASFLLAVFPIMLNMWPLKDGVVRLGGYVVNPEEYVPVSEELGRMFHLHFSSCQLLQDHHIRFFDLMDALATIRFNRQVKAIRQAATMGGASNLYALLGIDLGSCVLRDATLPGVPDERTINRATAFTFLAEELFKRTLSIYNQL